MIIIGCVPIGTVTFYDSQVWNTAQKWKVNWPYITDSNIITDFQWLPAVEFFCQWFISELLWGEMSHQILRFLPKMLIYVTNYTSNTNFTIRICEFPQYCSPRIIYQIGLNLAIKWNGSLMTDHYYELCNRVEGGSDISDYLGHLSHFFGGSSGLHPQINYLDMTWLFNRSHVL